MTDKACPQCGCTEPGCASGGHHLSTPERIRAAAGNLRSGLESALGTWLKKAAGKLESKQQ
jgi:hypothetical protein